MLDLSVKTYFQFLSANPERLPGQLVGRLVGSADPEVIQRISLGGSG